jgi:hypothetical protein
MSEEQSMTTDWDDAWLAEPVRRSRWRLVLAAALAASLVFLAGVEVQKAFGTSTASAASAPAGGFPSGMPSGLPSGMAAPGGATSTDDGAGSSSSSEATTQTEVIGTVVARHGDVWVVEDLGGTRHRITVSDETRIVRESSLSASDVRTGATVDITTTSDDAGSAATVTVR